MHSVFYQFSASLCRSSHEERGLKFLCSSAAAGGVRRSSHEERGLKSNYRDDVRRAVDVAPRMRSVD